jgi:hypothetical protein
MNKADLDAKVRELTGMGIDDFRAECSKWASKAIEVSPGIWKIPDINDIKVGMVFNTPFEHGCVVTGLPDETRHFEALDSDGVECLYTPEMVTFIQH